MENPFDTAVKAFEAKDFIKALELFSTLEDAQSKAYENKCVDNLEDIIYAARKKVALEMLERLKFYPDYAYFEDSYKRKRVDVYSKLFMYGCAAAATIFILVLFL